MAVRIVWWVVAVSSAVLGCAASGQEPVAATAKPATNSEEARDCGDAKGKLAKAVEQWEAEENAETVETFREACHCRVPDACAYLGIAYRDARTVPQDLKRAASMFRVACGDGSGGGCRGLGGLYAEGIGVPKDEWAATELYARSCGFGTGGACTDRGEMAEAKGEVSEARDWYGKGCELEDPAGCDSLGTALLDGPDPDPKRAVTIFRAACKQHDYQPACTHLVTYLKATGTERDAKKAEELLAGACTSDSVPQACAELARMYEKGDGVEPSKDRAAELYERACELGDKFACPAKPAAK